MLRKQNPQSVVRNKSASNSTSSIIAVVSNHHRTIQYNASKNIMLFLQHKSQVQYNAVRQHDTMLYIKYILRVVLIERKLA
jgi:hypothetical protein